jgi:chemotaxis protein MotB
MLHKSIIPSIIPAAAIFMVLFSSCHASKKLESAQGQIEQLKGKNEELEKSNEELKQQATGLDNRYKSLAADYDNYKKDCQETEGKLQVVRAVLMEEADNLEKVEKKLEEGMADFKDRGVDVEYKNGLVYVSMADNLLYKTGSAALSQNGKEALATLANVLNNYPNLKVIVVGHTDDVQTKKGTDNWSLSTERANGVVRLLTDTYNVEPSRITAAGKGKYDPVAENTSEAGRAKNRRTDIILNPDLVKVWNSVRKE